MYHGKTVPGFPYHPHKGFETFTIVNQGYCDHADSLGTCGRFGEGDVHWMTAGNGILHSEMFPLLNTAEANPIELFQIWINLPPEKKSCNPNFVMLWTEKLTRIKSEDGKTRVTVMVDTSNSFSNAQKVVPSDSWANYPDVELAILIIEMDPFAEYQLPLSTQSTMNRNLYFFEGDTITLDDKEIKLNSGVSLVPTIGVTIKNGNQKSRMLLLQGKPIGKPVVQQGPFVMNTHQELVMAYDQYSKTNFGGWPWESHEPIHPREKGRFAKLANGDESFPE